MADALRRSFLDRPLARAFAAVVLLGCVTALVYIERERLWQAAAHQGADDAFARCFAERAAEIDGMVAENVIEEAQAELFKSRAEAMCRATMEGAERGAPPLPQSRVLAMIEPRGPSR
jgi:hypothetical protein